MRSLLLGLLLFTCAPAMDAFMTSVRPRHSTTARVISTTRTAPNVVALARARGSGAASPSQNKKQPTARELREAEREEQLRKRKAGLTALKKIAQIMKERRARNEAIARGEGIPRPKAWKRVQPPAPEARVAAAAATPRPDRGRDDEPNSIGKLLGTLGELALTRAELAVLKQRKALLDMLPGGPNNSDE